MTEALGKDIWDFYVNGWPSSCSHDTGNREIAYWPSHFDIVGAICILQDDKKYDLKDFSTLWDCVTDNIITFEEAYLSWKDIEKPKPMTFDEWFYKTYSCSDKEENCVSFKKAMEEAWEAAIKYLEENR